MGQVEEVGLDDRTLLVLRVLESLESGSRLRSDVGNLGDNEGNLVTIEVVMVLEESAHLIFESLQHPVVDLVVEVVVDAGLLPHVLEQLVEQLAHSQPSIATNNLHK